MKRSRLQVNPPGHAFEVAEGAAAAAFGGFFEVAEGALDVGIGDAEAVGDADGEVVEGVVIGLAGLLGLLPGLLEEFIGAGHVHGDGVAGGVAEAEESGGSGDAGLDGGDEVIVGFFDAVEGLSTEDELGEVKFGLGEIAEADGVLEVLGGLVGIGGEAGGTVEVHFPEEDEAVDLAELGGADELAAGGIGIGLAEVLAYAAAGAATIPLGGFFEDVEDVRIRGDGGHALDGEIERGEDLGPLAPVFSLLALLFEAAELFDGGEPFASLQLAFDLAKAVGDEGGADGACDLGRGRDDGELEASGAQRAEEGVAICLGVVIVGVVLGGEELAAEFFPIGLFFA